jgi:hypothetical protein
MNNHRLLEIEMRKIVAAFAFAGVLGLAACEQREETVIIEDPVIEQPAPAVTEPQPITTPAAPGTTTDPMLPPDTLAAPADTL